MHPRQDPFASVRATSSVENPTAVDTLNEEERESLQCEILDLYNAYCPSSIDEPLYYQGSPTPNELSMWRSIFVDALALEPDFQRTVMDEHTMPGTHYLNTIRIRPDWMMGFYLPGFYHHFTSFEEGYIKELKDIVPGIVLDSRAAVAGIADRLEGRLVTDFISPKTGRLALGHWPTSGAIKQFFLAAQDEKMVNQSRAITFDSLHSLRDMLPDLPAAQKLHSRYSEAITGEGETLVDRFGEEVLLQLPEWTRTSTLDAIQVQDKFEDQLLDAVTVAEVTDGVVDEYETLESVVEDSTQSHIEGTTPDARTLVEPWGLDQVATEAASLHYSPISYPNWKAPSNKPFYFAKEPAFSLSQFDSQEVPLVDIGLYASRSPPRSKGFKRARMQSDKIMEDEKGAKPLPTETLMGQCFQYLRDAQQSAEGAYVEKAFTSLFNELRRTVRRDPDAENKELGSSAFRGFSDFIMKDNWWHVRCLFRGVGLFVAKHVPAQHTKTAKVKVESGERTVAVLIAMIGGGAKDSLPWVLTMDHYLRVLWTGIKEFFTSETPNELRQLFTELVTWVHGTIIVAYILRCRTRTGPANVVNEWYKLLYQRNSSCANPDCLRLLPHPDRVDPRYVRGIFSVGVREARNGRKAVRQFISTNRDFAYDCLYYVLEKCPPNHDTVVFIFWYAQLYHNERCKFARGKHAIVAF